MAFSSNYFDLLDQASQVERASASTDDRLWKDIKTIIDRELIHFIQGYQGELSPKVRTNKPGQNKSYYTSHWCLFCVDTRLEIGVKLAISPTDITLVYDFPRDKFSLTKNDKAVVDHLMTALHIEQIVKEDVIELSDNDLYEKINSYHASNREAYTRLYDVVSRLQSNQAKSKNGTSSQADNASNLKNSNLEQHREPLNQILFGPPGTGKTYNTIFKTLDVLGERAVDKNGNLTTTKTTWFENKEADRESAIQKFNELKDKGRIVFTTFHQSMSYEDFIEGIKPKTVGEKDVIYKVEDGIFKSICEKAKDANQPYVLIIDEINRGNVANIFGELITLIEDDKRLGELEKIEVQLPYSKKPFGVPSNLYIIGTMNTADRSVEALDSALRRRFSFVEMMPKPKLLEGVSISGFKNTTLMTLLEVINKRIEVLKDREHQIGHSYFMKFAGKGQVEADALKEVFTDKIIPLLQEYFYGDYEKIQLVLGNGFVKDDRVPVSFAGGNTSYDDIPEKRYKIVEPKDMQNALATLLNIPLAQGVEETSDQLEITDEA